MKYHKQLFRHEPQNGTHGDCMRTVLACVLDKDSPEDVPHFYAPEKQNEDGTYDYGPEDWLREQGLGELCMTFDSLKEAFETSRHISSRTLLTGYSANGTNHIVVIKDGAIEWDTSLNNSGIVGPCVDGAFAGKFCLSVIYRRI